ncbi:serine hydrolase domain-containing protein [Microbispora triticiradicis]|uniref:Beta-lactamase family protein n=2 Tax=Microbispora TaxID=2005 RepID=A0A5R8YYL5_9ACTN|nr:serine hydrolase domain-containing protein [Microbispora fusca]TLP58560.1 beta-lactamase family protein [Microbispora fusca]
MKRKRLTRRDFGRVAGLAGLGVAGGVLLPGARGTAHADTFEPEFPRPVFKVTGSTDPGLDAFNQAMSRFMQDRNISAGSLAVSRNGKLVLARGYSFSRNLHFTVEPTALFRLASVSKPITAAAVLKLVQAGKLSLDDKLTDRLTLTPPPGKTADARLGNVTVRRLLQHLGGWDRALTPDPMFLDSVIASELGVPLPISRSNIMRRTTGVRLDFDPGARYAYSNYGYMLLGRIIEKAGGMPYATYVQERILNPRGITRMRQGRSLPEYAAPGEVSYESKQEAVYVFDSSGSLVPSPDGGFNLENMDAHGGWLGSAVDVVRFGDLFDQRGIKYDPVLDHITFPTLEGDSIDQAFAQPEIGVQPGGWWYGCGWVVRNAGGGIDAAHNGSLPGTTTLLVRRHDGLNWAALFNRRRDDDTELDFDASIDNALRQAANAVTSWPSVNLYRDYL